jgi:hypothetical protein
LISSKLRIYTNCLKQLSILAEQLNIEPLKSRLRTKAWCLAYQFIENKQRIFKIVKPSEIYLDDDHQSAIDIKPLCAPDEPELIKLYELFGSKWLSENVQRTLIHRGTSYFIIKSIFSLVFLGKFFSTERTKKLYHLIYYRLDMLFVNNRVFIFFILNFYFILLFREKDYQILMKNVFNY